MASEPVRTVVVADDDPAMRRLTGIILERAGGYQVVGEASTGDETLDVVEREHPDLLLLDLSMPGRDGYDVLDQLTMRASPTRTVLFSGFAATEQRDAAIARGAIDFVEKGLEISKLIDRLQNLRQRLSNNED